ncbi:aspartate/glutamate racemase family protein [Sodalis sp. dw_96]|uniref:aspartate/glutamate racemase family protein n=1 Tax=Sodalis sp. dw_96 TaxID=2719794 RepID=UPI001BD238A7|nr:aspartate/glutamate racemase family protein [Sodalis sp. dw_96]
MLLTIGVLAGMGPRSTAPFIDMLVSSCQSLYGAKDDMDFPKMHIISLPTPFYPGRDIDDVKMILALQSGIADLVKAEVNLIVVPCNLAHRYFADMEEASAGIPVLHIADYAVKSLPPDAKKVAIIATEPTIEDGFYQQRLVAAGKEAISSPALRAHSTELINLVKEKGFKDEDVIASWRSLLLDAAALGAEAGLIACTDLSPLIDGGPKPFVMTDTAASLAEAAIQNLLA